MRRATLFCLAGSLALIAGVERGCAQETRAETAGQDTRPELTADLRSPILGAIRDRFDRATRPLRERNFILHELPERTNDAIARAVLDPDALWAFLTNPATPFADRGAAAYRGVRVFSYDQLPRLMRALGELRAEERQHSWGLRPNPDVISGPEVKAWWDDVLSHLQGWTESERSRTILGHVWRAPNTVVGWYPIPGELAETEASPWPLQVRLALEILLWQAAPKMGVSCPAEALARCEQWLEAALSLPCSTDEEGLLFAEAAGVMTHHVTERILARYRSVLVDSRFPRSAEWIIQSIAGIPRSAMCAAPETVAQFQVLILDTLTGPLPEVIRSRAAGLVPLLRETWSGVKRPEPATLILLLSHRGLEAPTRSEWNRVATAWAPLAVYLVSACRALDAPPFPPDSGMGGSIRPENASSWISRYRSWFDAHRSELERAAAAEKPTLDAARARLIELEAR